MANEILQKTGLSFIFADATDYPNTGAGPPTTAANDIEVGTATVAQIDLTGLAASGGARESDKIDLTALQGRDWIVNACLEFETAPADGGRVTFYWAGTPNATAASGNAGGLTGSDAGFTDTEGILGQLVYIGQITLRNNVINIGRAGIFRPVYRYGMLVVVNQGSTALRSTATAMDETHIVMTELIDEVQ